MSDSGGVALVPQTSSGEAKGSVTVRTHGKVNLSLHVGAAGADGYHPLRTVFQSLSLPEDVTISRGACVHEPGSPEPVEVTGADAARVPTGPENLAARAVRALAERCGRDPDVHIRVHKGVPVAGGMAGGSADAGAALVALDELWGTGLSRGQLVELAASLGADVPFTILGGTAQGTGRGERLVPVTVGAELSWVLAVRDHGLSTAAVYQRFDAVGKPSTLAADLDDDLLAGLAAGDPGRVGATLHNDLQPLALALVPELERTLSAAQEARACGAVVSGSGPTVAVLARDNEHASEIAAALYAAGTADRVLRATSCGGGARVIDQPRLSVTGSVAG